jgi:hypothetical protein
MITVNYTTTIQVDDQLGVLLLDDLADGQWHPIDKIRKNVGGKLRVLDSRAKVPTREELIARLDEFVADGLLRAGTGKTPSYRFNTDKLETWRTTSTTLDVEDKKYKPRYFGRILEDDGWELAPLRTLDLIHFRPTGTLTKRDLLALTQLGYDDIQIDEEGLFRIFTPAEQGEHYYAIIKNAETTNPEWGISGVRLEKNLKRRYLKDLPTGFLRDLCKYYGEFTQILLLKSMSSVRKHITEKDDIQQQIYIWVIEAVERYDATTSIPFGAYLGDALKKWVHNLNRKANGRGIADLELKYNRAIAEFQIKHERIPTDEELSQYFDSSIEQVRRERHNIDAMKNLSNAGTLYTAEGDDLPIASEEFVEDSHDAMVQNMLLSAAITQAASQLGGAAGMTGLLGLVYETWGNGVVNKSVSAWKNTERTRNAVGKVLMTARKIMDRADYS